MTVGKFLKSKIAFVLALIIFVLLLGSMFQKNSQQAKIEKEKQDLEKQAYDIETRNLELQKSLEYLSSESSKEKIARSQLNLKKQGETLFSFSEKSSQTITGNSKSIKSDSNFKKWVYYFSKPN